jgi:hypothetical protein
MRITRAPKSFKTLPQNGAGAKPANSITFIPFKAILMLFGYWKQVQRKNEVC